MPQENSQKTPPLHPGRPSFFSPPLTPRKLRENMDVNRAVIDALTKTLENIDALLAAGKKK